MTFDKQYKRDEIMMLILLWLFIHFFISFGKRFTVFFYFYLLTIDLPIHLQENVQ